jgi:hypothetical protein
MRIAARGDDGNAFCIVMVRASKPYVIRALELLLYGGNDD